MYHRIIVKDYPDGNFDEYVTRKYTLRDNGILEFVSGDHKFVYREWIMIESIPETNEEGFIINNGDLGRKIIRGCF